MIVVGIVGGSVFVANARFSSTSWIWSPRRRRCFPRRADASLFVAEFVSSWFALWPSCVLGRNCERRVFSFWVAIAFALRLSCDVPPFCVGHDAVIQNEDCLCRGPSPQYASHNARFIACCVFWALPKMRHLLGTRSHEGTRSINSLRVTFSFLDGFAAICITQGHP